MSFLNDPAFVSRICTGYLRRRWSFGANFAPSPAACERSDCGWLDVVRTYASARLSLGAGFAFRLPGASGDFGWVGLLCGGYLAATPARTSDLRATRDRRGSGASAGSVGVAGVTLPYARRERYLDHHPVIESLQTITAGYHTYV